MIILDWQNAQRASVLADGTDLDAVRRSGIYTVHEPVDGPSAGDFVIVVMNGVADGKRVTFQQAFRVSDQAFFFRAVEQPWEQLGSGGGGGGADTDITVTQNANNVVIDSSTGDGDTISAATNEVAGVMSAEDKAKLDSIDLSGEALVMILDNYFEGTSWRE